MLPIFCRFALFLTGTAQLKILKDIGIGFIFSGWFMIWIISLVKREESTAKSIVMIIMGVVVLLAPLYFL